MQTIDWSTIPYNHAGRWSKKFQSIMNPNGDKITFPQLVAEFVIYWRTEILSDYKDISYGPDWYIPIQKQVRVLNQQAYTICNYFPHPDDEPLVIVAFKNIFRKQRPLTIGAFRKVRQTKSGKINITQAEKDILSALKYELDRLIKQRNIFTDVVVKEKKENITFNSAKTYNQSKGLKGLMQIEEKLKADIKNSI